MVIDSRVRTMTAGLQGLTVCGLGNDTAKRGWTPNELARLLRVSPDRICDWIKRGELSAINTATHPYGRPRFVILPHHLEQVTPNFDVYLKDHAGDPLRCGRISRDGEMVEQPALSLALAVQPDVLQGLADQAIMRGRGFLARHLYGLPRSLLGARKIAARPVSPGVAAEYGRNVRALWELRGAVGEEGPEPHWLKFSAAADESLQRLERWLEPQLAEGEDLSYLAGWAQKLAGACARLAAILHVAGAIKDGPPPCTIDLDTVERAIRIGKDYLLPHAEAAFALMGADLRIDKARKLWASIVARSAYSADAPTRPEEGPDDNRGDAWEGED